MEPYSLPTLYKKTSTGAIQEWKVRVDPILNDAALGYPCGEIVVIYGQKDGAKTVAKDLIVSGKNIGRANETDALEQACLEAKSQWEKKCKKGYTQDLEQAKLGITDDTFVTGGADVMLAQSFSKHGHKITYPCYVQPKLDGHRCVAIVSGGVCTLWSRTRKPILGVPHIQRDLERIFEDQNVVLDGELYNHDYKDKFEQLTSFIRQETPKPGHEIVQYWVYDRINENSLSSRIESNENDLHLPFPDESNLRSSRIVLVPTEEVEDEEDLMFWFEQYLSIGFEGAMARNKSSKYVGKRSYDLQKIKEFDDAEFEVVAVEAGRGKMSDKGVFVCKTDAGNTFKAKMMGELDSLVDILDNPQNYIGRKVTVKFQGLTGKNGVPRFPVAVRMREDL